ncbi:TPA: helix-turn-helix transcriptional regulator [Clostridioides difficile]|nr:helix-turn-helix transcriptional regulator [Clostridioides difficile]HBG4838849.1 helix-turn-helix transcriptional regulator [Clostridioides difficile]HBH1636504.1 helix-turn-helix transcriptional regulator [Clostridioides difficile]
MDTMSERIMQIRAEQKLSKKDFGEIIGLSRSIISCYKKGLRKITERSTNIICREFSINKELIKRISILEDKHINLLNQLVN